MKELQKIEYLVKVKSFLDQIKNNFHSFLRAIILCKNKNLLKIADTSFKLYPEKKNILTKFSDYSFLK